LEEDERKEREVVDKLARIADSITAHEVVFATTAPHWSSRTDRLIRERLPPARRRLLQSL
jgi:hypothetical protein